MERILQTYQRRLTNLTSNNKSLLLLRLVCNQFIDLNDFDYLNQQSSFTIIEDLIAQKKKIKLCPNLDPRDDSNNVISKKLKGLSRMEAFLFEERGAKDLYVGWPYVEGKFQDDTVIRAPLLFFPVSIVQEKNQWKLITRNEVNITFNKSFLLAYAHYNNIKLEEDLFEYVFDTYNKDSTIFRTELYQLLKDSPLEINFNQDNFIDKLTSFEETNKATFERITATGELKLFPKAVLGIFPQAGSYIVPDYNTLIERKNFQDIEAFFYDRTIDEDKDKLNNRSPYFNHLQRIKEEETFTPYKMDAYQENALKAVKKGNSIVVQGPPGTGKSQLICNLISDYIAHGKKVLLVCQKRAALDVVAKRLEEKEIENFIGLVHDFKNDRKRIYEQVQNQINSIDEYKTKNNGLDSIQLERKHLHVSRKIDQASEELEEFKTALFNEEECGISIKELYLSSNPNEKFIDIRQIYSHFKFDHNLERFINKLKSYDKYHHQFDKDSHPWHERRSFKDLKISDLKTIKDILKEITPYISQKCQTVKELVHNDIDFINLEDINEKEDFIRELLSLTQDSKVFDALKHIVQIDHSDKDADILWLSNIEKIIFDCFANEGPETSLTTDDLVHFQEVLKNRINAMNNPFNSMIWHLFSKEKSYLNKVLEDNKLKGGKEDLERLSLRLDNRLNIEHNISKLKENELLQHIPETFRKEEFTSWFNIHLKAFKAKHIFSSLRNFKEYFNLNILSPKSFTGNIEALLKETKDIPIIKLRWLNYLTNLQITTIIDREGHSEILNNSLKKDFDSLNEFDKLKDSLNSKEVSLLQKLYENLSTASSNNIETLLQNSLRIAWIEHIETKYDILRAVSSQKMEQLESDLQNNIREKLQISKEILLLKVREKTYNNLSFNRLNNRVTYRDLEHQVSKKRQVWPLRKVINNFSEELFNLVPCWLTSPESVSAIFPMEKLFDLVIFDEASQCFVEKGIPAMYRGHQLVVTGDSKQLSPNDLYLTRYEEDTDDLPDLEVDSLLDLTSNYLMGVQLQHHYRSQSLDLIDFSNHYFYKDKLRLLPNFNRVNLKEPGISYIKVDGLWDKNTNSIEADKVVELIKGILINEPDKSIGVVTFNAKQQDLILDRLEQASIDDNILIPKSLFVKNIENVQGDEREIIIFSINYAPDKTGKLNAHFGSLNINKGENRLNVAITRAKEKVYIVSSILPTQLNVSKTKNDGPKFLKAYLEYAWMVSNGKYKPYIKSQSVHNGDWFLKNKIQKLYKNPDLKISNDLPFADLNLKDNNKHYLGLIRTDDDIYHDSISIKQDHAYTHFTLESKNWKTLKMHSREYWKDPEATKEKLNRFINQLHG